MDLFSLIGGSWPPAPREPEQAQYGTVPKVYRRTMQRPSQNERIKSVNLINHIAPEKRKNRPNLPSTAKSFNLEESQHKTKMVNEPKKIETGILVGEKKHVLCQKCISIGDVTGKLVSLGIL